MLINEDIKLSTVFSNNLNVLEINALVLETHLFWHLDNNFAIYL